MSSWYAQLLLDGSTDHILTQSLCNAELVWIIHMIQHEIINLMSLVSSTHSGQWKQHPLILCLSKLIITLQNNMQNKLFRTYHVFIYVASGADYRRMDYRVRINIIYPGAKWAHTIISSNCLSQSLKNRAQYITCAKLLNNLISSLMLLIKHVDLTIVIHEVVEMVNTLHKVLAV